MSVVCFLTLPLIALYALCWLGLRVEINFGNYFATMGLFLSLHFFTASLK